MTDTKRHVSISRDGFAAGPDQSHEHPLGQRRPELHIRKRVIPALIAGSLALTGVAAAAVPGGTYSGTTSFTFDGSHATHPFSLTVKKGKIVKVAVVATGTCSVFEASSGLTVAIPITKNAFDSSISVNGDTIKLAGSFKHGKAVGRMSGKLSAAGKHCSVIPAKFSASRA